MKRKILLFSIICLIASISISAISANNTTEIEPTLTLSVNGNMNTRIGVGDTFTFTATVSDSYSAGDIVTWYSELDNYTYTSTSTLNSGGVAVLSLSYNDISQYLTGMDEYVMQASYNLDGEVITDRVKFGILKENPSIIFIDNPFGLTVSVNDPIHLKTQTYPGPNSTSLTVTWSCSDPSKMPPGYFCPYYNAEEGDISYKTVGTYTINATVTDNDSKVGTTTFNIIVVNDPPEVSLATNKDSDSYEITETATVSLTASDKYGTIQKIMWGCSNDGNIDYDNEKIFEPSRKRETTSVTIDLPDFETDSFECSFKATDDDGEEGIASVVFKTNLPVQQPTTPMETTKTEEKKENPTTVDFIHIYVSMFIVSCIGLYVLRKRYD